MTSLKTISIETFRKILEIVYPFEIRHHTVLWEGCRQVLCYNCTKLSLEEASKLYTKCLQLYLTDKIVNELRFKENCIYFCA